MTLYSWPTSVSSTRSMDTSCEKGKTCLKISQWPRSSYNYLLLIQKMGRYKFYLIKVPRLIESFTLSFGLRIWVGTVPEFCWWKDCLVQGPLVQHGDGWDSVLYRGQHHHKGQGNCRTNRVTYIFCTYTVGTVSHCMCKSVILVVRSAVTKANTSFGTAGWSERALF